jgi:hypothetical protein
MTAFCSHQDRLHRLADVRGPIASASYRQDVSRLAALVRRAVDRTIAAFGPRDDRSLEPAASCELDGNARQFPQRPMILGDKWDF